MTAMCPSQRPLPSAGIMSATTVSMAMEGASEEVPATPLEVRLHEAFCPPSNPKLYLLVTSLSPPQHRIAQSHATFITSVALSACPPFGWWYLLLGLHRFATRPYLKHIRRRTHTRTHTWYARYLLGLFEGYPSCPIHVTHLVSPFTPSAPYASSPSVATASLRGRGSPHHGQRHLPR